MKKTIITNYLFILKKDLLSSRVNCKPNKKMILYMRGIILYMMEWGPSGALETEKTFLVNILILIQL